LCADWGGAGEEEKCLETRAARVEDEEDTLTGTGCREGERGEREGKRVGEEGGEAEEIRERDEGGTAVGRGTRCRNTAGAVGGRSNGAISLSLSLSSFSALLFSRLF
jgi:hypothetical protein